MIRKVYVKVTVTFDTNGAIHPDIIFFEDDQKYVIDKVLESRRAASLKAGGAGIRYTVRILGKETYLFLENGRWFVEAKC